MNTTFEIDLFKSLFKGREDVFAIRWEKGDKNGYMPAYSYDPYRLQLHKRKGGTFQNFNEKKYIELSDEEIAKHLKGDKQIGVYPLLKDNTSWFIAADFDKENWAEECRKFLNSCKENNIPAYLERSRSGKGGHVWIFFSQPYPAIKSRKIFVSILEKSGILSAFEKTSSFDRLFPNQDFLSGKGLGNLIALPLFKNTLDKGNNCFIDPSSLHPYPDQWEVLKNIQRIATADLDKLFKSISNSSVTFLPTATEKLSIRLNNVVKISRIGLTAPLVKKRRA